MLGLNNKIKMMRSILINNEDIEIILVLLFTKNLRSV